MPSNAAKVIRQLAIRIDRNSHSSALELKQKLICTSTMLQYLDAHKVERITAGV